MELNNPRLFFKRELFNCLLKSAPSLPVNFILLKIEVDCQSAVDICLICETHFKKMKYMEVIFMPVSLRIPLDKAEMIRKAAAKARKTRTAYILEAIDEKLGLAQNREQIIRELAGWMSHEDAEELRSSLRLFEAIVD